MKKRKTSFFDVFTEAIKAEVKTDTGRINIIVIVLMAIVVIVLLPASAVENIVNGVLGYFDKKPLPALPDYVVPVLIFGTIGFFILCLFVVRSMEIRKTELKDKKDNLEKL